MPQPDFVTRVIAKFSNGLHFILDAPDQPLGAWIFVWIEERGRLLMFLATEIYADHAGVPPEHRAAVAAEAAKPRRDDQLLLFSIRGGKREVATIDRARIDRELGPRFLVDARNHFPLPWPMGWHGPYALDLKEVYRIDTPDCLVIARVEEVWDDEDLDDEGQPRYRALLELGVTQAMDPALASDEQIAAITAKFRHCGRWVDNTHKFPRRHPSRRIFQAEIGAHAEGTPTPELQPLPAMLAPPPGWEPVGTFRDRPLVFRIEGTNLRVAWTPPAGADFLAAATGRLEKPSQFTISTARRKPTDEEVEMISATLGGATFSEEKRRAASRAKPAAKTTARVFRSTAGWLRRP